MILWDNSELLAWDPQRKGFNRFYLDVMIVSNIYTTKYTLYSIKIYTKNYSNPNKRLYINDIMRRRGLQGNVRTYWFNMVKSF